MAIQVFGVTYQKVRAHHFPQMQVDFSVHSNPTAATVAEMIEASAAELAGALRKEGLSATTLVADTASEAYSWCAETIRLGAAARVIGAMTQQDPEVAKAWLKRYEARLEALDEGGAEILGDAAVPSDGGGNGPRTHIQSLGLDVGSSDLASDLIPTFRRSDKL